MSYEDQLRHAYPQLFPSPGLVLTSHNLCIALQRIAKISPKRYAYVSEEQFSQILRIAIQEGGISAKRFAEGIPVVARTVAGWLDNRASRPETRMFVVEWIVRSITGDMETLASGQKPSNDN